MPLKRYLKIWYLLTVSAVMTDLTRFGSLIFFLLGKGVRILLFAFFLVILLTGKKIILGYSFDQVMIFYLTFNLIDGLSQLFLRGAYYFRRLVVSGSLDFILLRPLNSLFLVLFSHTDVLDFIMLGPIIFFLIYLFSRLPGLQTLNLVFYFLLVLSGLLIAISFHILVVSLAITTYEVDNSLMIYRDLSAVARVPVDLYREPLRFVFTFILPVGVMVTFPVKALLGLLSWPLILTSIVISVFFFIISLVVWKKSLKSYTSASS